MFMVNMLLVDRNSESRDTPMSLGLTTGQMPGFLHRAPRDLPMSPGLWIDDGGSFKSEYPLCLFERSRHFLYVFLKDQELSNKVLTGYWLFKAY